MIPAIGFFIVMMIGGMLAKFRAEYLFRASKSVFIDNATHIVLKSAYWAYLFPIWTLVLGVIASGEAIDETGVNRMIFAFIALYCLGGGCFLYYRLKNSRAIIISRKLIYSSPWQHREIQSTDVSSFSLNWFTFQIKLKSGQLVRMPASFESSEVALAFLQQAAGKNT